MDNFENSIKWLLSGEGWIRYNTIVHLLDLDPSHPQALAAYKSMTQDKKIQSLLDDIQEWESTVLKRHNDTNHPIHKLSFLAEIGFPGNDPKILQCLGLIYKHISSEGPFQTLSNYPTHFGGSGNDEWLWVLCDTPLIVYCLIKFGLNQDPRVCHAYTHLISTVRKNGWPCTATIDLGKFRGPGKASAPCPYANLLMLKAAAAMKDARNTDAVEAGIDTLLWLWENSYSAHPFLFKMGKNFQKLKVPFIWYDILHVLDVLSQFPYARQKKTYSQMVKIIRNKENKNFRYKSESVWMKWKGWKFCQKREPSRWVTFAILRILKRSGLINLNYLEKDVLLA